MRGRTGFRSAPHSFCNWGLHARHVACYRLPMTTTRTQKPAIQIYRINEYGDAIPVHVCYGWKVARADVARLNAKGSTIYVAHYAR